MAKKLKSFQKCWHLKTYVILLLYGKVKSNVCNIFCCTPFNQRRVNPLFFFLIRWLFQAWKKSIKNNGACHTMHYHLNKKGLLFKDFLVQDHITMFYVDTNVCPYNWKLINNPIIKSLKINAAHWLSLTCNIMFSKHEMLYIWIFNRRKMIKNIWHFLQWLLRSKQMNSNFWKILNPT
jgi:hypothetical protein